MLHGHYSIRQADLKFLTGGPLFDGARQEVTVVPYPRLESFQRFLIDHPLPTIVGFLGACASVFGAIACYP